MSELVGLNVLEVVRVNQRQVKEDNGSTRIISSASIKCEGGEFYLPIKDGLEVPQGWSGKAYCSGRVVSRVQTFKGDSRTVCTVTPVEIQKFQKIKEITKVDALSSFGLDGIVGGSQK